MHSLRETASGGHYKSLLTNRVYSFVKDRDGASQRQAFSTMEAEDKTVLAANNARALPILGRELTLREHLSGDWLPDNRTTSERVREDMQFFSQPKPDPDRNVYRSRQIELEGQLATARPSQKQALLNRISLARDAADRFDAGLNTRKAHESLMASPDVVTALVYGRAWVALLSTDHTAPAEWVEGAQRRVKELESTGDHKKFYEENDAWEAERKATLKELTLMLDEKALAVREQAKQLKRVIDEPLNVEASE